jgi:hypothetical protein
MKLLNQTLSVLLVALLLQGCQLGTDDEDDEEIETTALTTDDFDGTVSANDDGDEYKVRISANGNIVTLEDDVSEISITGDSNEVTIDSDTLIDKIYINGDSNSILVEGDVDLTVTDLTVIGNANYIYVYDITNTPVISANDTDADNLVCEDGVCS